MSLDPYTLRVLGLPGGGTRGYMQNYAMQMFCQQSGIEGVDLYKYFDVIAGTSVGGIAALSYAFGNSPDFNYNFYIEDAPWVFTTRTAADKLSGSINASLPSNRPTVPEKVIILGQNDQLYSSVNENSNYGGARLKKVIENTFGDATMQDLKTNVIITAKEVETNTYRLFSNMDLPGLIGQNDLISNVALATSAAHFYLPPHSFNGLTYQDGGVFQNNPTRLGLSFAKQLKPNANRFCVFTAGTGVKPDLGFQGSDGVPFPYEQTVKTLIAAFEDALYGSAEAVHTALYSESQYSASNLFYAMTRPFLDAAQNTELDNSGIDYIEYQTNLIQEWYLANSPEVSNFIGHFFA